MSFSAPKSSAQCELSRTYFIIYIFRFLFTYFRYIIKAFKLRAHSKSYKTLSLLKFMALWSAHINKLLETAVIHTQMIM